MNTTDEGFSFSFHKNYKLGPTYPRHAIFSLRELQHTSPSALSAATSSRYTNLIPLRTKFDTQTKRVPAWPVINQLWFPERHFSANGISLRLGEVQTKICKGWLQALLSSAPRGFATRSRVLARLVSLAQIGELARRLLPGLQTVRPTSSARNRKFWVHGSSQRPWANRPRKGSFRPSTICTTSSLSVHQAKTWECQLALRFMQPKRL